MRILNNQKYSVYLNISKSSLVKLAMNRALTLDLSEAGFWFPNPDSMASRCRSTGGRKNHGDDTIKIHVTIRFINQICQKMGLFPTQESKGEDDYFSLDHI